MSKGGYCRVEEDGIIADVGYKKMTPLEILELVKSLQDALFDWVKLTGKSLDKPKCF